MATTHAPSTGFSPDDFRHIGFSGGATVAEVRRAPGVVPLDVGVYAVFRSSVGTPAFLNQNAAFWFKGNDPTVAVAILKARWIPESALLYVGKAPGGSTGGRGLRVRVSELVRFGAGERAAHWGGRYQWQVAGSDGHLILWRPVADPTGLENELLASFQARCGRYPFANIAGPRS